LHRAERITLYCHLDGGREMANTQTIIRTEVAAISDSQSRTTAAATGLSNELFDNPAALALVKKVVHAAGQFSKSILYTALCEPVLAAAQTVDKIAGTNSMPALDAEFDQGGLKPSQANNALDKNAQAAGGAVGMVLPYLLLHKQLRAGAGKLLGVDCIALRTDLDSCGKAKFADSIRIEAPLSFATGSIYGACLAPSDNSKKGGAFIKDRLLNGLEEGAVMSTMTASSLGSSRLLESLPSEQIEESQMARQITSMFKHPATTGLYAALPSALVGAEIDALRHGKLTPTEASVDSNIKQMAFTGMLLGCARFAETPSFNQPTDTMLVPKLEPKTEGITCNGVWIPFDQGLLHRSSKLSSTNDGTIIYENPNGHLGDHGAYRVEVRPDGSQTEYLNGAFRKVLDKVWCCAREIETLANGDKIVRNSSGLWNGNSPTELQLRK
jgi:hypothetical protein